MTEPATPTADVPPMTDSIAIAVPCEDLKWIRSALESVQACAASPMCTCNGVAIGVALSIVDALYPKPEPEDDWKPRPLCPDCVGSGWVTHHWSAPEGKIGLRVWQERCLECAIAHALTKMKKVEAEPTPSDD